MADDTLTFAIGGRVEIGQFQQGITRFQQLVVALTHGSEVSWVVEDLQHGSAVTTLRGEAGDIGTVGKDCSRVRQHRQGPGVGRTLLFGRPVNQAAEAIKALAQSVEYIRFETPTGDYTILGNGKAPHRRTFSVSIGAISGRVQTLSNRGGLRFNVYDTVHDKAVGCYLQLGQEELMREAWGRRARVSGRVSREHDSGRPVAVRQILDIEILEDIAPGSYRLARGAVPWQPGDELPEDVIRRLRDG